MLSYMSNHTSPSNAPIDGVDRATWIDMAVTLTEVFIGSGTSQYDLMMKIIDEGATDEYVAACRTRGLI